LREFVVEAEAAITRAEANVLASWSADWAVSRAAPRSGKAGARAKRWARRDCTPSRYGTGGA
jgi:hypothetical protein